MSHRSSLTAMAMLMALGCSSNVWAQDALGAGDALDANSQVGSGGRNNRNPNAVRNSDFRDRNYIVTDNVAGGRGFRGNVGYQASGDFTGYLGSDDSKGFRSYSALSDLIFITSPQQMDSFNIAQGTGVFEFRRDFSSLPEVNNVYAARTLDDAQIRLDRSTLALSAGTLYATAVDPADVGIIDLENGRFNVTASPLEGVGKSLMDDPFDGYTLYDRATAREEMAVSGKLSMVSEQSPFLSNFDRARIATKFEELGEVPPEKIQAQIDGAGLTTGAYQEIVDRVLEKYADREDVKLDVLNADAILRNASKDLSRLEAKISGYSEADARNTPLEDRILNTDEHFQGLPGVPTPGLNPAASGDDEEETPGSNEEASATEGEEASNTPSGLSISEMAEILRHRTEINELSITDKTRLARTVKLGEEALKEGRFFKAERRFEDALRINPGNPLLELARANAQIGAGLYLSAALTLKRVFLAHPEVIDSRFKPEMLPTRTRLEFSAVAIRERLERGNDVQGYGLTLAYIGIQLGDQDMVREGLKFINGEGWDEFGLLLSKIWDENDAPPKEVSPVENASEEAPKDASPVENANEEAPGN